MLNGILDISTQLCKADGLISTFESNSMIYLIGLSNAKPEQVHYSFIEADTFLNGYLSVTWPGD
jgi:hypothetical protein